MDSVFRPSTSDDRYVTYWTALLDNYMHEYHIIGDEWLRLRNNVESSSADKRKSAIRQFVVKNVADKFISTYGSGAVSATDIIPSESIDSFVDVLVERLSPESLRYV